MTEKNFPNVIKKDGIEKGEMLFLLEKRERNKIFRELMKATQKSVIKITEPVVKGKDLPVYVQILNTLYYTGSMGEM